MKEIKLSSEKKEAILKNVEVAPDTHVIQASERLGLITHDELEKPAIREKVSLLWEDGRMRCRII